MTAPIIGWPHHKISVVINGTQVVGWETYEIHVSMLVPDSHFTLRMPFSLDAWQACEPDTQVSVLVDDVTVIKGYIDERLVPEDDEAVEISGRNAGGRLLQDCAPSLYFAGLDINTLMTTMAQPFVGSVTFSNERNRTIQRGRGKKARASSEPVVLFTKRNLGSRINPGMTRWQVISDICTQAGYLAWLSGDGLELIIGQPNYEQEIQFKFFQPAADSTRTDESTVLGMGVRESVLSRFSQLIVVGSGTGTDQNYGGSVATIYASVFNNPANTTDGTGVDFRFPKRCIVPAAVLTPAEAQEVAIREMAKRDATKNPITVRAPGHGQVIAGAYTTLFCPDTLALVEDERTQTKGSYVITSCTFRSHRKDGEETLLELLPKGSLLIS